jgi:ABC-type nitrate/sulfonate/bicarbonate transport system substrate-binding protein
VAAQSTFQNLADLENSKAAISRHGSGSQLMAYVNAKNQGWNSNQLQFEIVNTIDGAITALTNGTADYFMWERFMTQPLVDQGIFRRIADCPTPWPCFVIAVREDVLATQPEAIATLLKIINAKTQEFKTIPNITDRLATTYHQKTEDIKEWLSLTEWSQERMNSSMVDRIQKQLLDLHIIDKTIPVTQLV